jgi:site-specific DNA-methyltransferase (adenine-specific)/modification methylase
MDLFRLQAIREDLRIDRLTVMCTGEIDVDWRELRELQFTDDGRSLKRTDDGKILKLAESLLRFGIINNLQVWVDEAGAEVFCFDAHHRKKALLVLEEIGLEIPSLPATRCLARDILEAKKLLLLKESRTSWVDVEVIPDYLKDIGFDFSVASATIDLPELNWGEFDSAAMDEESEARSERKPHVDDENVLIESGSLIELGRHRLLCGDCGDLSAVDRLLDGRSVDLVFSDPPYGIDAVQGDKAGGGGELRFGKIGGGLIVPSSTYKKVEGDQGLEAAENFYRVCAEFGFENIILWGGNYFTGFLPPSRCWLVWDKQINGNFSDAEMAWTSFDKGGVRLFKYTWNGLVREGERKDELISRIHPTQKPVGLFTRIFETYDWAHTILDGFLGSGSTLIACEKTHRRCYAMEIDPYYVHLAVQRWVDYTGIDEIIIDGRKVSWSQLTSSAA